MDFGAIDFLLKGGPFMIPLGLCSLVALTIIFERGLALRQANVVNPDLAALIDELGNGRRLSDLEGAIAVDRSSLGRLVATILRHQDGPRSETVDAVQMQARHEVLGLERNLVILEIIVGVAPLLGLLGTVSGLTTIFGSIGEQGIQTQGMVIAKGIAEALNTTIAGLVIAIPALVAWSYYTKKVENLAAEMESLCGELISKLSRLPTGN